MTPKRVLVTRPAREAARWVLALGARGFDALALPLLAIEALEDDRGLRAARTQAGSYDALMFVSAAAVQHFFAGQPMVQPLDGPRCWATGPGTAAALQEAGVPPARIDVPAPDAGQFDSEALWQIVRPQLVAASRVLIVRGGDAQGRASGRDWLAREIAAAGARHDTLVAYRRVAPPWSEMQRSLALAAANDGSIWLFSSSQAIANLLQELPHAAWSRARAIATHARIAQAAREAGFGVVVASNASLDALAASIESFQ
jgi:uroporphyrinogen-III synthase